MSKIVPSTETVILWLKRLLCFLNINHDWRDGWCDDGKGNSGAYAECRACGKAIEGF